MSRIYDYLERFVSDPSYMVLTGIVIGALALYIITRGKWR
jgi:hypothetical protein